MKINNPHNNLFKKVMELPTVAAALIMRFFPSKILDELDLSTLQQASTSYMTEELTPYFSDIIYSCMRAGQQTYISILFEHKSRYELPDLQLLSYTIHGYKKQENRWKTNDQKTTDKTKNIAKRASFVPTLISVSYTHLTLPTTPYV